MCVLIVPGFMAYNLSVYVFMTYASSMFAFITMSHSPASYTARTDACMNFACVYMRVFVHTLPVVSVIADFKDPSQREDDGCDKDG